VAASAAPALSDAAGHECGVRERDSRHVAVEDIEIVADAGCPQNETARRSRSAVIMRKDAPGGYGSVRLARFEIHDVFATEEQPDEGARCTSNRGRGITAMAGPGRLAGVTVEACPIRRVGRASINLGGGDRAVETDFFGNRVSNQPPDIGAIVHGGKTGTFSVGASRDRRAKPFQVGL
jgi:hypothetical protein